MESPEGSPQPGDSPREKLAPRTPGGLSPESSRVSTRWHRSPSASGRSAAMASTTNGFSTTTGISMYQRTRGFWDAPSSTIVRQGVILHSTRVNHRGIADDTPGPGAPDERLGHLCCGNGGPGRARQERRHASIFPFLTSLSNRRPRTPHAGSYNLRRRPGADGKEFSMRPRIPASTFVLPQTPAGTDYSPTRHTLSPVKRAPAFSFGGRPDLNKRVANGIPGPGARPPSPHLPQAKTTLAHPPRSSRTRHVRYDVVPRPAGAYSPPRTIESSPGAVGIRFGRKCGPSAIEPVNPGSPGPGTFNPGATAPASSTGFTFGLRTEASSKSVLKGEPSVMLFDTSDLSGTGRSPRRRSGPAAVPVRAQPAPAAPSVPGFSPSTVHRSRAEPPSPPPRRRALGTITTTLRPAAPGRPSAWGRGPGLTTGSLQCRCA